MLKTSIPDVYRGSIDCGDYDNDGDQDVLLSGLDNCYGFISSIFCNYGKIRKKPKAETESSIWATTPLSFVKTPSYYYFVYSSCYCSPYGQGKKDADEARRKVIREYQDESFTVHYVN